jgi:hypothetical protein
MGIIGYSIFRKKHGKHISVVITKNATTKDLLVAVGLKMLVAI